MRKINGTMNRLTVTAYVKGIRMKERVAGILARKEGEGFVDTALKILISVVVGGAPAGRALHAVQRHHPAHTDTEDHQPVQLPGLISCFASNYEYCDKDVTKL